MPVACARRCFNAVAVHLLGFLNAVELFERLSTVIISRPVVRIGGENRTELGHRLLQLPTVLVFIGQHVA